MVWEYDRHYVILSIARKDISQFSDNFFVITQVITLKCQQGPPQTSKCTVCVDTGHILSTYMHFSIFLYVHYCLDIFLIVFIF